MVFKFSLIHGTALPIWDGNKSTDSKESIKDTQKYMIIDSSGSNHTIIKLIRDKELNLLYKNVIKGGCVIFDEYYSYKYPGAKIAVDEFFVGKQGYFEKYVTSEGFERWCFIKR